LIEINPLLSLIKEFSVAIISSGSELKDVQDLMEKNISFHAFWSLKLCPTKAKWPSHYNGSHAVTT